MARKGAPCQVISSRGDEHAMRSPRTAASRQPCLSDLRSALHVILLESSEHGAEARHSESANMKLLPLLLVCLAAAGTLSSAPALAMNATSGPGMMRCTVVIGRLSSSEVSDRMPVLTWAQGYLSGMAAVATALDGSSDVEVPAYDALQPRILKLCKADPTSDLLHVARRLSANRNRDL